MSGNISTGGALHPFQGYNCWASTRWIRQRTTTTFPHSNATSLYSNDPHSSTQLNPISARQKERIYTEAWYIEALTLQKKKTATMMFFSYLWNILHFQSFKWSGVTNYSSFDTSWTAEIIATDVSPMIFDHSYQRLCAQSRTLNNFTRWKQKRAIDCLRVIRDACVWFDWIRVFTCVTQTTCLTACEVLLAVRWVRQGFFFFFLGGGGGGKKPSKACKGRGDSVEAEETSWPNCIEEIRSGVLCSLDYRLFQTRRPSELKQKVTESIGRQTCVKTRLICCCMA